MNTERAMKSLVLVVMLGSSLLSFAQPGESEVTVTLDSELARLVDQVIAGTGDPRSRAPEVWRDCVLHHGSIEPLIVELEGRLAKEQTAAQKRSTLRLIARLLRHLGDLERALTFLEQIPDDDEGVQDCMSKAEVLDAIGRNDDALAAYDRLLTYDVEDALENRIRLRQALIRKAAKDKDDAPSPLAVFARGLKERDLRNQAAVVLALREEQKEAIDIFEVAGEGTRRFRQEIRLAEWALEAEEWDRAQEFAWSACQSAALKRDRRYSLTILAESYRRDDALEELVVRLEKQPELDAQSRQMWIDLLRETGRFDDALRLFRGSSGGDFTIDMRRELLEICRESGRDDILVSAYQDLIQTEPRFIEWREGLSRWYLERGNREAAEAVWRPYLEVTDETRYRMAAAATLMSIGLDELAVQFARASMVDDQSRSTAFLFLFELHVTRGRMEEAEAALKELDDSAEPGAAVRKDLAEAFARIGNKRRAVEVLESVREAMGTETSPDTEMKLAVLYSEIGEEEKAMELWYGIWRRIDSIPRRRYVEGRLMSVASRLGKLAKIAVDLEKKLAEGTADDRDAGLLVRLYTKVKDPVSAAEVIEEFMATSGKKPVEVLNEKGRIFLSCQDYYNYEKVIQELIDVDPDGRPDYMRQLAMSKLERGRRDEARALLEKLKEEEADTASLEFEAGVLSLAGMREEASQAYRRSLALHPERIDTYLLLSNIIKELGQHDRSAGMFQFLAATAEKDDLFTIAVDGILNMRDGRANRGAPDRLVEWARRITLERIARRPDKLYLYQLVADLSDELKDKGMGIRALKTALPVAGEQRTSLLRELMNMSKKGNARAGMIIMGGPQRAVESEVNTQQLMFGRRLLGQGQLVPPQVYLELGEAFLAAGEVVNATKTFNQASQLPEFTDMQRDIAQAFEKAQYPREALRIYERILTVETTDVGLILKVGELQEQLGRDSVALELYSRGADLLLARRPFVVSKKKKSEDAKPDVNNPFGMYVGRNVDEYETHFQWLMKGMLATLPSTEAEASMASLREKIESDLTRVRTEEREDDDTLKRYPRLKSRAELYRRLAVAYSHFEQADELDRALLEIFPGDEKLLEQFCRFRIRWGYVVSARRLIETSDRPEKQKKKLRLLAGGGGDDDLPGAIAVGEAASLFLPLLVEGRDDEARKILERLDLSTGEKTDVEHMPLLMSTAIYLGNSEIALGLCRHWLNLMVRHTPGALYGAVEQTLQHSRMVLDTDQQRSLIEQIVNTVVEKPDKFSIFIQRLPDLQKTFGSELLTTEQVEKLITGRLDASDRFIYGIPELFALVPAKDRASVLRAVWEKVQKAQRAMFLIQLLPKLDQKVDDSFGDFLVGSFKESLKDIDSNLNLTYYVEQLIEGSSSNLALVGRFVDILVEKEPNEPAYQVARALCLHKEGKEDEAWQVGKESFAGLLGGSKSDYRVTSAIQQLVDAFYEDHLDGLVAVIDEAEEKSGKSVELTQRRLDLIRREANADALLEALEVAVQDHPDEVKFYTRLRRELDTRGYRFEAIAVQEKLVELKPKNKAHRNRLATEWSRLRNPVRALEAKRGPEKIDEEAARHVKERTPPASIGAVKKAVDGDDSEVARSTFRRLWRVFPDRTNQYFRYQYDYQISQRYYWPRDPRKRDKPYRGGLPELRSGQKPQSESEKKKKEEENRLRSAHEVLAEHEFGRGEIRRQIRSMTPLQLNGEVATDGYRAMAAREIEQVGRVAALARLLEIEKEGRAGKVEYGLLFALLEDDPKGVGRDLGPMLDGLLENLNAKDTAQLRRLARLHTQAGSPRKAAVLYRWCATQQSRGGFYSRAHGLLEEVIDNLDGDVRDRVVEDVLAFGDPGEDAFWGRDNYERLVLDTWTTLVGPEKALEKARAICERVTALGDMPKRQATPVAAYLYARAGEHARALDCLEVALCKLEPPAQGLKYPWYRTYFDNPGHLNYNDMGRLFPEYLEGWTDPEGWFLAASQKIAEWHDAKRLRDRTAFSILAVLALRTLESGREAEGQALLAKVQELAADNANDLLWIVDIARRTGDDARADEIERRLFDEKRLQIERVPEVVARVRDSKGVEAGLELGEFAGDYTLHPDLVDANVAMARDLGRAARASFWTEQKAAAEAAEAELEKETD